MLMLSRMWQLNKFMDAGVVMGGGQINRSFELDAPGGVEIDATTKSLILPFVGPRISFNFDFIGLSLGYAAYWAKTDVEMDFPGQGRLTGEQSGWGTGFYSPILVLNLYDKKRDMLIGLGLGGFLGMSNPDLVAESGSARVTTDESPIDGLTFHVSVLWSTERSKRLRQKKEQLDDF